MYQFGKVDRVLIVAPLSILGVWKEEFEKFEFEKHGFLCRFSRI